MGLNEKKPACYARGMADSKYQGLKKFGIDDLDILDLFKFLEGLDPRSGTEDQDVKIEVEIRLPEDSFKKVEARATKNIRFGRETYTDRTLCYQTTTGQTQILIRPCDPTPAPEDHNSRRVFSYIERIPKRSSEWCGPRPKD